MANRVGVDMLGSHNSSTFSRLFPVSRDPTVQLTTHFRRRETPAEYPPVSPNQSSGTLDQQRTIELGNEMRAVQSTYTARIGDQDLSPTVRDLYRLVTTLAAEAVPQSDGHLGSSIEKANMVRTIDRYVRETTSDYNTALCELSSRTRDTRLFRFHAHLGDYAEHVCNLLKGLDKKSPVKVLKRPWTDIVDILDTHQDSVAAWIASGYQGPQPICPEMDAIELRVSQIIEAGTTELDIDLALFAIRSYARRNFIAHGGTFELDDGSVELAEYIDNDDKLLEEILPDEEKPMVGNWRRLLMIRRNTPLKQKDDADWIAKDPLISESSALSFGRGGRAVLRTRIEMGLQRGSNSPDGPPPTNVAFDPSSYRRHSDPGRRPIPKRPAVGQPSGESSPKRAKGPYYVPGLEAIPEDINDQNVQEAEELQLSLHTLAAELAQSKPGQAIHVFRQQIANLNRELERTRTKIVKQKRAQKKQKHKVLKGS